VPERLVPTLRELQRAFARAISGVGGSAGALDIPEWMAPRLEIYANTRFGTLRQTLGLTFPAVRALVGTPFFETLTRDFTAQAAPASAYLNDYGGELPRFLRSYEPTASIAYLADVAMLEWAVSRACHAPDAPRLDPRRLTALPPEDLGRVIFTPHPSVAILRLDYPADCIWRAVLEQDETAMRSIDLAAGPVYLLIERGLDEEVQVRRLGHEAWSMTRRLLAGQPLFRALSIEPEPAEPGAGSAQATLAEHLSARRFAAYRLDVAQGDPSL
jgi:hypothetical protein